MDGHRDGRRPGGWSDASGRAALSGLMGLLIVVAGVYAGMKFIPVRAAAFQFDDAVREQVVLAGSGRRRVTEDEIRVALLSRAEELGLAIERRDILIRKRNESIRVRVQYMVPVHLVFGYVYEWHFDADYNGPSF